MPKGRLKLTFLWTRGAWGGPKGRARRRRTPRLRYPHDHQNAPMQHRTLVHHSSTRGKPRDAAATQDSLRVAHAAMGFNPMISHRIADPALH